jgi:hypothetical protein
MAIALVIAGCFFPVVESWFGTGKQKEWLKLSGAPSF